MKISNTSSVARAINYGWCHHTSWKKLREVWKSFGFPPADIYTLRSDGRFFCSFVTSDGHLWFSPLTKNRSLCEFFDLPF